MKNTPARSRAAKTAGASRLPICAIAMALALAGCSDEGLFADSPGVEFTVLEPSDKPPAPVPFADVRERRQVQEVTRLEFGTIHDGRMMTAWGLAPESDWFSPQLQMRREGLPGPDGFVEFDFVAAPPALNGGVTGPVGTPAKRVVRADIPMPNALTDGAVGVRVHAENGAIAQRF